jgi:hypothetical protein
MQITLKQGAGDQGETLGDTPPPLIPSGKRPLPAMRFYGPTNGLNNKTFKLNEFELMSI